MALHQELRGCAVGNGVRCRQTTVMGNLTQSSLAGRAAHRLRSGLWQHRPLSVASVGLAPLSAQLCRGAHVHPLHTYSFERLGTLRAMLHLESASSIADASNEVGCRQRVVSLTPSCFWRASAS